MFQLNKKHLRYDTYTSTNIDWIGAIPNGWEVKKIKMFGKTIAGGTPKTEVKEYWDGNIPWLPSGMVQNCVIYNNDNGKYITQKGLLESSTKEIPANSPLVALTGATCANVALLKFKATANQSVIGLAVNNKNNPEFLYYSFLANRKQFLFYQTGGAQGGINLDNVKNIYLSAPPLSEQEKIAKYLDEKTILLEEIIEKKQNQIKLLSEHKTALINNAITKGLDPKVELKESGVNRVGMKPLHWDLVKIKHFTYVKGRIGWQNLRSEEFSDEGILCITGSDFRGKIIDYKSCYRVGLERYEQDENIQLKSDDLLITKDGTIGKVMLIKDLNEKATLNSGIFLTRPLKKKYIQEFMYYVLTSKMFQEFILINSSGSTIKHLYQNVFEKFSYSLPSIKEQKEIVEYLDKEIKYIDDMVEKLEKSIQLMKEYKTSLISHAVSGKIKI